MPKLTAKQAKFVTEYLKDGNGTQAAIRAGYSAKTAEVTASKLLRNGKVGDALAAKQKKVEEKSDLTIHSILKDLETIKQNAMKPGDDSNPQAALKACELQGKTLGMFTDKVQVTGANGGPIQTEINVNFIETKKEN